MPPIDEEGNEWGQIALLLVAGAASPPPAIDTVAIEIAVAYSSNARRTCVGFPWGARPSLS